MIFAKGHGTENDFVLLPDVDAALTLTAAGSGIAAGARAILNGEPAGSTLAGSLELTLPEPGMYNWTIER